MAKAKASLESLRKTYPQIKAVLKRRLKESKKKKKATKRRRNGRAPRVTQSEKNLTTAIKAKKSADRRKQKLPSRLLPLPKTPRTVEICKSEGNDPSSKLHYMMALGLIPILEIEKKQKRGVVLRRHIPMLIPGNINGPRVVLVKHMNNKKITVSSKKEMPKVEEASTSAIPPTPTRRRGRLPATAATPIRSSSRKLKPKRVCFCCCD